MDEKPRATGFVSLQSMKQGGPDAASALADIRRIYFRTTRKTIEHDFAHAVELLKSLPTEEERERATVFMEGLAEMRKEWAMADRHPEPRTVRAENVRRTGSHGGTGKGRRREKTKRDR